MTIERAAATATDTLDSTSDVLINGLTLTPSSHPDGYLLQASVQFSNAATAGSEKNTFSVYVGGSIISHTEREYDEDTSVDNVDLTYLISAIVDPNGSQAVEIRHRASASASPLIAKSRELTLFPIPAAGTELEATATANDTIASSTWATLNSMTFINPAADDYYLAFNTSHEGPSTNEGGFRVTVGGTAIAHTTRRQEQEESLPDTRAPMAIFCKVSPNGSQNVEIEFSRISGSGTLTVGQRTLALIPVDGGDIFEASGTADDSNSGTSDVAIDDMLITDPGAADYIEAFTTSVFLGNITSDTETIYRLREAGSTVTDSDRRNDREASIDNVNMFAGAGGRVTVSSGTSDLQQFWQSNKTFTATARERTLVAMREAAAGGLTVNMGLVTEADLAQSLGKAKARAIGLTTETDLAQPLVTTQSINIGLVSESEVSQAFSALKQRAIGLLTEANLAQVFSKSKTKQIGLTSESDLSQPFGKTKSKAIGLVSETELAQTLAASKALAIGIITETELAQAIGRAKAKAIGLLSETDQVFAFDTIGLTVNMGLVLETDIAQTLGKTKDKAIGLLTEADLAPAVSSAKSTPLGLITEFDIPFALGTAKLRSIGLIAELDASLAFAAERGVDIGLLLETDNVFAMSAARALSLGLVSESDIVFSWSSPSIIVVTNLVQRDARFQVKLRRDARFAQTSKRSTRFQVRLRRDGLFTETLKRESKFAQSVKRDAKF